MNLHGRKRPSPADFLPPTKRPTPHQLCSAAETSPAPPLPDSDALTPPARSFIAAKNMTPAIAALPLRLHPESDSACQIPGIPHSNSAAKKSQAPLPGSDSACRVPGIPHPNSAAKNQKQAASPAFAALPPCLHPGSASRQFPPSLRRPDSAAETLTPVPAPAFESLPPSLHVVPSNPPEWSSSAAPHTRNSKRMDMLLKWREVNVYMETFVFPQLNTTNSDGSENEKQSEEDNDCSAAESTCINLSETVPNSFVGFVQSHLDFAQTWD